MSQPIAKSYKGARTQPDQRGPVVKKGVATGIVKYCVQGHSDMELREAHYTPTQMIQSVRKGLPISELNALQTSMHVPMERLALKLGISKATLHRRKNEGRLAPEESDRVVRFARLLGIAAKVLETEENARQWLQSPQFGLGGEVPLDYAKTELGAREVEDLLGRIEYGVYS